MLLRQAKFEPTKSLRFISTNASVTQRLVRFRAFTFKLKNEKSPSNKDYSRIALASVTLLTTALYLIKTQSNFNSSNDSNSGKKNRVVTFEELQSHNSLEDCWIAIHGKVYDITEFLSNHPGGVARIFRFAGNDATRGFSSMHSDKYLERHLPEECQIGEIHDLPSQVKANKKKAKKEKKNKVEIMKEEETDEVTPAKGFVKSHHKKSHKRQRIVILEDGGEDEDDTTLKEKMEEVRQNNISRMPPLSSICSLSDFEYVAKKILPPVAWGYLSTGSSDEFTLRENHYALGRIFFRPRCLIDVSKVTMHTEMLGERTELPFYIGAFCGSHLIQDQGESVLTKAAGNNGIVHLIPKHGAVKLDELKDHFKPDQAVFYQHDFYTREEVENIGELFKKIETEMPNVKAIFINVDIPAVGNREKDNKIREQINDDMASNLNSLVSDDVTYATLSWEDFKRFKSLTKLPIVIKGMQRKEDIVRAAELGFKGVLISNHGGRQLDYSVSTIEVLAQSRQLMRERGIDRPDFELFVEGGFRRGTDIIKALCLGAKPGLGRGMLYSEVYGQAGVEKAIDILRQEICRDMKLLGARSVADLNEDFLDLKSLEFKLTTDDRLYNKNYTPLMGPSFTARR